MKDLKSFSQSNPGFKFNAGKKWLLYTAILLSTSFLTLTLSHAQVSVDIKSGIVLSIQNGEEIVLDGDWTNNGMFKPGTGTVTFNGLTMQTITNADTFHNVTVNKASGDVQMNSNTVVSGTFSLLSGDVDLNGFNITMTPTVALLTETAGNTVKGITGFIQTTRDLNAPTNNNVAGLGFEITTAVNLGSTIIKRGHGVQTANNSNSILRFFDVVPTTNSGLNADIVFHYDESELNSNTEAGLQHYRSTDGGTTWFFRNGTPDPANNKVSLTAVDALSRWTLSSSQLNNITCTLEAETDTNQIGTEHTVTVTVNQSGVAQQGVEVMFEVFKGPNMGTNGPGTSPTDVNGEATFTYTGGNTPGVDSIKVSGTFNNEPFECFAEKVWVDNQCTLTPETDQNQIGTDHTVTATITQNGNPVQGVDVKFHVFQGPNNNMPTPIQQTDANGQVAHTYTSNNLVGVDSIKAYGTINGVPFECLAEKKWVEATVINGLIKPTAQLPFYNEIAHTFEFELSLTNISPNPIFAPLFIQFVTLNTLTPPPGQDVTVANANRGGNTVGAVHDYSDSLGSDGRLDPGETTSFKLWIFDDPDDRNFHFFANVFGALIGGPSSMAKTMNNESFQFIVNIKNESLDIIRGTTEVEKPVPVEIPTEFALHQNYPNPFNPETTIRFELPQSENVTLNIYNLHGQLVRKLVNENREAGFHEIVWDAQDDAGQIMPSGVYLYRITSGGFIEVRKLMLLR